MRGVTLLCLTVLLALSLGDVHSEAQGGDELELGQFMFSYIEHLETLINKTEDTRLKYEISGLFKLLLPSLKQIIKIESRPLRQHKLRKLIPELRDIENLINFVKQKKNVLSPEKSYRIDETPFDKEILLTLYDKFEGDKTESSNPPWYPQNSNRDTTTTRPYKVELYRPMGLVRYF